MVFRIPCTSIVCSWLPLLFLAPTLLFPGVQVRQMMVKDNILKSMLNEKAAKQLKLDAPDPSDFMSGPGDAPSAGGGGGGKVPPGAPPPQGGAK